MKILRNGDYTGFYESRLQKLFVLSQAGRTDVGRPAKNTCSILDRRLCHSEDDVAGIKTQATRRR